jgi:hypothetical protein
VVGSIHVAMFDTFVSRLRAFFGEPLANSLRRRLRAAAPSEISELREDLHCRIAGTVRVLDRSTLLAPLSGVTCVAYLLEVIATDRAGDVHLLIYDKKAVPFVLAHEGHHALVDPQHSQLLVSVAHELRVRDGFPADPRPREVLERYQARPSWGSTRAIRYREWVVEPGQSVSIAGVGRREVDPHAVVERGYRDHARQRLRFVGSEQLPLLVGDDPP